MSRLRRAYFINDRRFTPSQFRRLSSDRKVDAMVDWFGRNYEDPANRVSYETREGGYQWGGAGPHDANEVLQDQFSDLASLEDIEAAVEEVTGEGTFDWASTRFFDNPNDDFDEHGNRSVELPMPDFEFELPVGDLRVAAGEVADGDDEQWPPIVGVPINERELRNEVVARLDRFEATLDAYVADRAHRGHNRPPEMLEDDEPLSARDLEDWRATADELRRETQELETDDSRVIESARKLLSFAAKFGKGLAVMVGGGIISGAAWDGVKAAYMNSGALYVAGMDLAKAAAEWGNHLLNAF